MTSPTASQTSVRLEATFGLGRDWTSQAGQSATVWETPAYHLLWFDDAASDVELRRLWEARKGHQAYPVVLLAPLEDDSKVRIAGPQDARPVRELSAGRVLDLLETSRSLAAREAASFLARELSRLEEAVVPSTYVTCRDNPEETAFEDAFRSSDRVQGLTHDFYKYPARFSPHFVRFILDHCTEPGDYVLDPFMGGGTMIVEAIASGRCAIGSDVNELSYFVTRVKTTPLSLQDVADIRVWVAKVKDAAGELDSMPPLAPSPVRNMPPNSYSFFSTATKLATSLGLARRRRFARCALLRVGQWALDSRLLIPTNTEIADNLEQRVHAMLGGLGALVSAAKESGTYKNKITAERRLLPYSAANPMLARVLQRRGVSPKLILTSPPYPGVHMLYHRWQIQGRRETPAPYWIADLRDGHGEAYYTMGSRSTLGSRNYFERLRAAFRNIRAIGSSDTKVVQLIAFSRAETQLPLYLEAMEAAGFAESCIGSISSRQERAVPNRKWYTQGRSSNDASSEVFLVHRPRC